MKYLLMILKKSFHERIVLLLLFIEYVSPFKLPMKVLRKLIIQCIYHVEINPVVFESKLAISTLRLPHPFGIVLHKNVIIEPYVTLFHGVTIGVIEKDGLYYDAPHIRYGAYIGTGAVILGGCVIGRNAKIAANSTILKSVDDETTALGIWK